MLTTKNKSGAFILAVWGGGVCLTILNAMFLSKNLQKKKLKWKDEM